MPAHAPLLEYLETLGSGGFDTFNPQLFAGEPRWAPDSFMKRGTAVGVVCARRPLVFLIMRFYRGEFMRSLEVYASFFEAM
jgi:hypothetical protein